MTHAPDLVEFLRSRAQRLSVPPIVYPTSDAFVSFVSANREALEPCMRLALPDRDTVETAMDKSKQYALARRVGVPIADTHSPTSLQEVIALAPSLTYPVIVKPAVGHVWRHTYRRDKALRVEGPDALVGLFKDVFAAGQSALIQSLIVGPNTNHCKVCAYYGQDGTPLAVLLMRKIRQYPVDFGVGTLMETVNDPELRALGLRFFDAIGWRGPGSIEFKRDERDGVWRMIELNPRLWQQNGLAAAAGMNFPLVQHRDFEGHAVPTESYRAGARWLDEFRDLQSVWAHRTLGRFGMRDWVGSLKGVGCFALWADDDPGPFGRALAARTRAQIGKRVSRWQQLPSLGAD
jgi:predicted ATP-grasp superfamily ATP-dependent carboligase